jgi:hypothetical protein
LFEFEELIGRATEPSPKPLREYRETDERKRAAPQHKKRSPGVGPGERRQKVGRGASCQAPDPAHTGRRQGAFRLTHMIYDSALSKANLLAVIT